MQGKLQSLLHWKIVDEFYLVKLHALWNLENGCLVGVTERGGGVAAAAAGVDEYFVDEELA